MSQKILTQEGLKKLLEYNPETGVFIRKTTVSNNAKAGSVAGHISKRDGYCKISVENKQYYAHRLAFLYMTGRFPESIDHINHSKNDNRWLNLRETTQLYNCRNKSLSKRNNSGVCGVYWYKPTEKWCAQIRIKINGNTKTIHLGHFKNKNDAISARKEAERNYGFHINHGKEM